MFNTKLRGRSIISILHRTHKYTWHRRQKQLSPIVIVSNEITKAVPSDNAELRTGKNRPQPVPMSDRFVGCGRRCARKPDSLMWDMKRLQASSRGANNVGKPQFTSANSSEQSGNRILSADLCTLSTNWTRQAGNAAHREMHILIWAAQGYSKPE